MDARMMRVGRLSLMLGEISFTTMHGVSMYQKDDSPLIKVNMASM